MGNRAASLKRNTEETKISIELNLDGVGQYKIDTGNAFFDHLLAQLSRHGLIDLTLSATGDIDTGLHHTVEDIGILLGRAFRKALGEGLSINRMGHSFVPLDEALAMVVLDVSGRGYSILELNLSEQEMAGLSPDLIRHFLEAFARESGITLHAKTMSGLNNHHKAEAIFKGLARALKDAVQIDKRILGTIPSTKGTIS